MLFFIFWGGSMSKIVETNFGTLVDSKRVARGAIVTPKSSGRGTPATAPPATAPTATTTSTTTAASQNFLKNIDPKLAAGIAAGTLGAAGLAAFVANRRRKKKRG